MNVTIFSSEKYFLLPFDNISRRKQAVQYDIYRIEYDYDEVVIFVVEKKRTLLIRTLPIYSLVLYHVPCTAAGAKDPTYPICTYMYGVHM